MTIVHEAACTVVCAKYRSNQVTLSSLDQSLCKIMVTDVGAIHAVVLMCHEPLRTRLPIFLSTTFRPQSFVPDSRSGSCEMSTHR